MCGVARCQQKKNRHLDFEHPLAASSWQLPSFEGLLNDEDVANVVVHMCQLNLSSVDESGKGLCKKPTRVLTNLPSIAESLGRKCSGDHRHVQLMSGRATAAVQYTEEFRNAIVDGVSVVLELMTM